ncbi:hypothetical protein Tco_0944775, partial [Tanacetum coccineum]
LSAEDALDMVRMVNDEEIKIEMFQIDGNKAPGPDGFSAYFFKKAWSIVGTDVCNTIKEFFRTGKLLNEVNSTLISLIPKIQTPDKVTDFRPIACCNVLYKCISKIIIDIMKNALEKCENSYFLKVGSSMEYQADGILCCLKMVLVGQGHVT